MLAEVVARVPLSSLKKRKEQKKMREDEEESNHGNITDREIVVAFYLFIFYTHNIILISFFKTLLFHSLVPKNPIVRNEQRVKLIRAYVFLFSFPFFSRRIIEGYMKFGFQQRPV